MFSVAAYPLSRSVELPLTRRGGTLAYVRAASLAVWMFTLVLQYWYIGSWEDLQEQARQGSEIRSDFITGFTICFVAHLTLGISVLMGAPFDVLKTWSGRLFTIFCALVLLLAPISLVPTTSFVYGLGTWATYILVFLYWQSDYRVVQRMLVFAGFVILTWMFLLIAKNGLSFGFAIGGLNRNTSAGAGLAGMICCLVSPKKSVRWAAIAAGVFLAMSVSSRGTMVAMAIFFFTYYTCYNGVYRAAMHGLVVAIAAFAIMLAIPSLNHVLLEDILHLHDSSRGIGSGFTGRFDAWKQAFGAFWQNPIFGVGFRATTHRGHGSYGGVHSGYLKLFVETGFVGAFLVISAVVLEGIRRFKLALRFHDMPQQAAPMIDVAATTRINAVACGTIAMMLGFWVYEQLYINIGSAISVVFFLMMVAPGYVVKQGVSTR